MNWALLQTPIMWISLPGQLNPFTPKLPTSKGIRIDEMSVDPDHIQDHVCLGSLQPGAPEPVHRQLALLLPGLSCQPSRLEAGSSSAFGGSEGSGPGHSMSLEPPWAGG